jgi:GR25 family glycosyltransferase involved in LPS biosynthesis
MHVPIYYINLASRGDRRVFMEDQLTRLGLVAERIEAVTIDQVPQPLLDYHASTPKQACSPAAVACSLSHAKVWTTMLARGDESAIILEDDAVLDPALVAFTRPGLLRKIRANVVKLETWRKPAILGSHSARVGSVEVKELTTTQLGTAAYLLDRKAAKKSLAATGLHKMPIDQTVFATNGAHILRSRVLQAVPSPVVQMHKHAPDSDLARSDITPGPHNVSGPSPRAFGNQRRMFMLRLRRAAVLALRDPAAVFRPPVTIPFAGDAR